MELFSSNIKKILLFPEMKPCTFRPQPSKCFPKKTRSEKISYILSKESYSYISGNRTLLFSVQCREIKKIHPEKISYTSSNENPEKFLVFSQKKAVLMFQEVTFRVQKMKKLFIFFQEIKLFNPKLKNSSFLGEPVRVFHHCFFKYFHFTIDFYYCFRVFSLFLQMFLFHL